MGAPSAWVMDVVRSLRLEQVNVRIHRRLATRDDDESERDRLDAHTHVSSS
jgi:hypothetical protein